MVRGRSLLVLLASMRPATAGADSFVEASGGVTAPGGWPAWTDLAGPSPKLAVRAGTMDRRWTDRVVSVDWTPIRTERPDTSAHRIRALGSHVFNTRASALDLSVRAGIGLDFLRVRSGSARDTLIGYAFELGVGVWFATGPVELGGDLAIPMALNGSAVVGDLALDTYVSLDVDLLVGVRRVWR